MRDSATVRFLDVRMQVRVAEMGAGMGPRKSKAATLVLIVTSLVVSGCRNMTPIPASYCAVVSTTDADNAKLFGIFEHFAKSEKLEIYSSDPGARAFLSDDEDVELVVTAGIGSLGSLVVLYGPNGRELTSEKARIETFVLHNVADVWRVRDCATVKDLKPPALYK